MCLRVRPCSDRASRDSSDRETTIWSPSWATFTDDGRVIELVPFGPLMSTAPARTATFTPCGNLTGRRPTRDMGSPPSCLSSRSSLASPASIESIELIATCSPNRAEDLAADVLLARAMVDHHALRRRQHVDAE